EELSDRHEVAHGSQHFDDRCEARAAEGAEELLRAVRHEDNADDEPDEKKRPIDGRTIADRGFGQHDVLFQRDHSRVFCPAVPPSERSASKPSFLSSRTRVARSGGESADAARSMSRACSAKIPEMSFLPLAVRCTTRVRRSVRWARRSTSPC